jgi:hypothetical protein
LISSESVMATERRLLTILASCRTGEQNGNDWQDRELGDLGGSSVLLQVEANASRLLPLSSGQDRGVVFRAAPLTGLTIERRRRACGYKVFV